MTGPTAHVVTVGVAGEAPGTPLGALLALAGVPIASRVTVEDDEGALEHALGSPAALTVILTGTGGSAGDIVRRVLARAAGVRLALNDRMLAAIEERYRRRDRPMPRREERLALLPQGAALWTSGESDPAWMLDSPGGAFVVIARGSARPIVDEHLVPFARARFAGRGVVLVRTLRTVGVPVGDVEERLIGWLGKDGDVTVVVVPADGEVWVRLRARGATLTESEAALARTEAEARAVLGDDCYGADADTLEQTVGTLLRAREMTLAVAESCTGGLLGHRITSLAGSSAYFERGVIVYSNLAKMELLGVPEAILRAHGAVSTETAEAMARGICAAARTACGLSVTGIAGPDGATPGKPVGTVFIGMAVGNDVSARRFQFAGDRASVKWQSTQMALDMLRRKLGEV